MMPLTLLLGPANCGKVALLLDRFAEAGRRGDAPTLVVPNRPDVELAERDLLARRGVVLGGLTGTFEDLFETRAGALRRAVPLALRPVRGAWCWSRSFATRSWTALAAAVALPRVRRRPGAGVRRPGRLGDAAAARPPPGRLRRCRPPCGAGRASCRVPRAPVGAGIRDRAGAHGRAAELLETRLEAWDGSPVLRLRVRGHVRCAAGGAAGAGGAAATCPCRCPTSPAARRWPQCGRPSTRSPTGRTTLIELPAAAMPTRRCSLHLERALFDERELEPPARRRLDRAARGLRRARRRRPGGVRGAAADPRRHVGRADRRAGARHRRLAARRRERLRGALAIPVDVDAPVALGDDRASARRCSGCCGSPGSAASAATSSASCARPSRASRAPPSTMPRAGCAGRGARLHDEVAALLEELEYQRLLVAPERLAQPGDPAGRGRRPVRPDERRGRAG